MDWIKDKKNLPIVAGVGALILIGAIFAILYEMGVIGGAAPDTTASVPAPVAAPATPAGAPSSAPAGAPPSAPPGYPGGPPGAPAAGGTTASASGAPGAAKPGAPGAPAPPAAPVNVAKGPDPFTVPGYPPKNIAGPRRGPVGAGAIRRLVPFVYLARLPSDNPQTNNGRLPTPVPPDVNIRITPEESTNMRVSGVVLTGNGVHAVLESNGRPQQVQPGDILDNGGKVLSIQSDGLTLRAPDNRLIHVPLSGSAGGSTTIGTSYPGA